MADVEGAGLVVYNGRTSKMCRVESDFMKSPTDPNFVIANQSYYFPDTIYGLAIVDRGKYFFLTKLVKRFTVRIEIVHKTDFGL